MESPNSSVFSVTSAPSVISDIYDIGAHVEHGDSDSRESGACAPSTLDEVPLIPEHNGKPMFEPGDGDTVIEINGTRFEVHKYLLKRFAGWKNKINERASELLLSVRGGEHIVEDFRNTFKILYATVLEGPFDFDSSILVSALRIATAYDYPTLRTYAIGWLEDSQLAAIERIKIAREFKLASWEEPAYTELCERDNPISREEANILGMDAFVLVAEIREQEQRRRGKEVDARKGSANADRGDNKLARDPPPLSSCLPQPPPPPPSVPVPIHYPKPLPFAQASTSSCGVPLPSQPPACAAIPVSPPLLLDVSVLPPTNSFPPPDSISVSLIPSPALPSLPSSHTPVDEAVGREFQFPAWEESVYAELSERTEPITREEAKILRTDAFALVDEMREREQRRRNREAAAQQGSECANRGADGSAQNLDPSPVYPPVSYDYPPMTTDYLDSSPYYPPASPYYPDAYECSVYGSPDQLANQ